MGTYITTNGISIAFYVPDTFFVVKPESDSIPIFFSPNSHKFLYLGTLFSIIIYFLYLEEKTRGKKRN